MCDKQNGGCGCGRRDDYGCSRREDCGCGRRDDYGFFDRSDVQGVQGTNPNREDCPRRENGCGRGHSHRRCGVCGVVDCIKDLFCGCGCRRR